MKKNIILVVLFLFFINNIKAQSNYYYANYQRQYWHEDPTSINIIVANMQNYNLVVRNLQTVFSSNTDTVRYGNDDDNIIVISDKLRTLDLPTLLSSISQDPTDISFVTYAKKIDNRRIWLRNEVYVKLKNNTSYSTYLMPFMSHFSNYSLDYDDEENDYKITCNNETILLQIANGLYDTQYVHYSTPDFYCEMSLNTIDPYYGEQWALNNIGQEGGEVGVDIKAEKAWEFLQHYNNNLGDSIRVAVIDDGVDTVHEDLTDALGHRRVLDGFPSSFGKGYPKYPYQFHGTACAGVIAASHNNIGVAGIAPNALIVPIRIQRGEGDFFSGRRIQKAITKAWEEYNAQVLNVTWIGHFVDFIPTALQKAMDQGRNGKGCVVVVASGNDGYSQVEFPASVDNVIAVGAVDRCGYRAGCSNWTTSCDPWPKNASSYGSELSVVAPGSNVYSTDRMGNDGTVNGNYALFGGTSTACPHVAGVAALILSINPNLTHSQVKEIIEKTAQKVGGYHYYIADGHPNGTWHEEVGYGMVNAVRALAEAKIYGVEYAISGPSTLQLCNEYTYTLSGNIPEGYDIVWEINPQMAIVSGQGTSSLVVRPIYQAMGNWVKVRICFDGETIREYMKSPIASTGFGYQLVTPYDTTISQNTLWNLERSLANTVTIDSGAVLTITNTIHCTDNARLIVRPGGKLVVDGGTLTSACSGEMWQGIEVVGDRTKHQLAQYQGTVELRNGATIENAHCAIRTGLAGGAGYATAGGIIRAEDAHFVNNRRSVEFISYMDTLAGGSLGDNVSRFQNTEFIVNDNNLFAANNCDFIDHVTLWQVRGVEFEGCTFKNLTSDLTNRRHAIYAEDAGFTVTTYCEQHASSQPECECPEEYATHCDFSGFANAVEVNTTGEQCPVMVDGADFSNNAIGVRINGNHFATVTRCRFNQSSLPGNSRGNYGLYLDGCTGYKVEQDTFLRAAYPSGPLAIDNSTGIYVSNSGASANSLYLNAFFNLTRGISVSGTNGNFKSGLAFSCNTFNDCHYGVYASSDATLAPTQGSLSKGADNHFSGTQTSSLYNLGSPLLMYYHSNGLLMNLANPVGVMAESNLAASNPCASTLCNYNGGGSVYLAGFQSGMNAYVTALAENANADGTGKDETLAGMRQSLSETYYEVVRALMSDTVLDLSQLEQWHAAAQPIADPYSLTETRFMEGYAETFAGNAENAEMANYAEFHAMKLALRNNDDAVGANNYSPLPPDGHINWYALTPAQIAQLQTIAERNTGRASVMAKGVLCFFFGICYDDEVFVNDNTDNQDNLDNLDNQDNQGDPETRNAKAAQQDGETTLTVYPNPTDDLLYIELSGAGIANIALYDLQGRAVYSQNSSNSPTATLNMHNIPAGVYVLHVTDKDGREYQQKVVRR